MLKFLNNVERYICQLLLAGFVCLLFMQIIARGFFSYSFSWTEELSVYMFAWFVFFGASYATRLAAHNRVTFHYRWLPAWLSTGLELLSDLIWLCFSGYFTYLSYDFVFNRMNLFWKSQTLGVPMKYIYMVLPLAFALMTLRILQVNYARHIKGTNTHSPDAIAATSNTGRPHTSIEVKHTNG